MADLQTNGCSGAALVFRCPFDGCSGNSGWRGSQALLKHMERIHLQSGSVPSAEWLRDMRRWICGRCNRLIPLGRKCRGCGLSAQGESPPQKRGRSSSPSPEATAAIDQHFSLLDSAPSPWVPPRHPSVAAPSLESVLTSRVPTMRHIPKAARIPCAEAFTAALEAFAQTPDLSTSFLVLAFPKLVLRAIPRGGRKHQKQAAKLVFARLQQWRTGQFHQLLTLGSPVPARTRRAEPPAEPDSISPSLRRAVVQAAADGALSKAARLLFNGSTPSADAHAALQALHPAADPVEPGTRPAGDLLDIARSSVLRAALSFPPGSGAGPSGFRPMFLRELLQCGPSTVQDNLLDSLTKLVNLLANGHAPLSLAPHFAGARLMGLGKPAGGVRPIAVGETLRRLVGKCILAVQGPVLATLLAPRQVGVGVPSACELIVHSVREWHEQNTGEQALVFLDFRNAFNSLKRSRFLPEVRSRAPALSAWADWCYCTPSPLYTDQGIISSAEGVQQGDPLGPSLFAIGTLSVVELAHGLVEWGVWYLDDGTLAGTPSQLSHAIASIGPLLQSLGLELNCSKTLVWGDSARFPPDSILTRFSHVPLSSGMRVLGSYVGPDDRLGEFCSKRVSDLERFSERLGQLDCPQTGLLILRSCLGACKLSYASRTIPFALLDSMLSACSHIIRESLCSLLGKSLDDLAWLQSCLPLAKGGMGIQDPFTVGSVAFLSGSLCFALSAHTVGWDRSTALPIGFLDACVRVQSLLGGQSEVLSRWMASGAIGLLAPSEAAELSSQHTWSAQVSEHAVAAWDAMAPPRERFRRECQSPAPCPGVSICASL